MSEKLLTNLHRLSAVWGPAGREHKVAEAISELIAPHVDEVRRDRFGNLIASKRGAGGGKKVMLTAHMDTIGAMAINISDKGLIHLTPVGRFKAHYAIGQRVVWGSGVTGILQHEPVDDPKEIKMEKLWCDIGATSKEEALENVRLGDMCTFVGELQQLGDQLSGPGLDDRAGCAILIEVAEHLGLVDHDVVFAFTSQGEIGPRGAGTAAYGTLPDVAFAVDVHAAGDVPRAPRLQTKLGDGPAIKLKDAGYMAHHGLSSLVRAVGEEHSIPLQVEIVTGPGGHNDAQVVSVAGQGVPTAVIDVPARYLGTGAEMVNLRDLNAVADLVMKILESPIDLA